METETPFGIEILYAVCQMKYAIACGCHGLARDLSHSQELDGTGPPDRFSVNWRIMRPMFYLSTQQAAGVSPAHRPETRGEKRFRPEYNI
ncbi:MAG TPA: hypothetical protein PL033_13045 [Candidatus Brocadiia bacterium]|nr:hypothetical protein [Candidatus Brocadiia bacterium]HOX38910.1 hypothetical protein [Candidatus Brocadiia bacterium]